MDQPAVSQRDALQGVLGDVFTLEDELTGGGMSTVYRARDNALQRPVVIKVLPPDLAAAVSVERFKREILLSAGLQHPHIVPVLSAGEVDGLPYFVMPFIHGESLRSRLTRGPLSVRETVNILKDVARALSHAHTNDVIHRDIKPDNIMITGGTAVVTDFGVAKALDASQAPRRRASGVLPRRRRSPPPGWPWGRRPTWPPSRRPATPTPIIAPTSMRSASSPGDADGYGSVPWNVAAASDVVAGDEDATFGCDPAL